ncbi:ATP-dependent RecD-like DNA helicase [Alkalihalophilus pseudofirmus]|uniref:ATP-dependent DNA helicase n=1 Tax=Alkalihalophilus pseudofirmus TaxID=79885 RepID=UPI00259B5C17|nr:ATP-dependent RecD-like DNA helicase [Alkalihalophilus pseudofirmus]WEG18532.1 ATP-dependent RecD-like DNA helicase [Alkalihalophilus pseudofirmus]
MNETISLRVEVAKEIRYFDNGFGIYSFYPLSNHSSVKINKSYGNFSVKGNTFQLAEGMEYEIEITPTEFHPQYGQGYEFVSVKQDRPTSAQEQQVYIKTLLTDTQARAIIDKYPNDKILDLMREDKFDYSDIKGIGKKTYVKIKKHLLDNLDIQEAIIELKDLKISFPAMKKLIDHYGSAEMAVQKIKENIYNLCSVSNFGFKTVDKFAMNRGDSKESRNRILAGLTFLLAQEESNGHCWMSKFTLMEKARELLEISRTIIEDNIDSLPEKAFYVEGDTVARRVAYNTEKNIMKKLIELRDAESKIDVKYDEEKVKELEKEQGFEYSDEQREAIKLAMENNVLVINGKAGAGKTTVLKGIVKLLDQYNHAACALSGKASKVLSENGLQGSTIHRLLGIESDGFKYNEDNPLPKHILFIDETSMINIYLFFDILRAVENGYKLIIVGDDGQLSSIGSGAVLRDLLASDLLPTIELTKVQRQAEKSGILSIANKIREGEQIIKSGDYGKKVFGELKDLLVIPMEHKEQIIDLTIDIAKRKFINKDLHEFQFITGRKQGGDISVYELNNALQKVFNEKKGKPIEKNKYSFYEGDKVIQCGNNYDVDGTGVNVFNGTIGIIEKIEHGVTDIDKKKKNFIHIQFEGIEEPVVYTEDDMIMIELAYAISTHRSQGSTIPYVIFVFDYASYMLLSKQFCYTGITRAKKGAVMICELSALRHAIKTDVSDMRRTFLSELL